MFAYAIDDSGYIIENYLIGGDVEIPDYCIDIQLPQPLPFHKPKWDGDQWVEGATQEEIDDFNINKPTPQPSEIEVLTNYVLDVDMRLVMVEMGLL